MALPKKRKKLENNSGSGTAAGIPTDAVNDKKTTRTRKNTGAAKKTKSTEQMNKAFEIIEQIETANGIAKTPPLGDSPSESPRKIRFKISFDGSAPTSVNTGEEQSAAVQNPTEVNFGITIPSFVWKVPILKKAAQKVLQKLSPQD